MKSIKIFCVTKDEYDLIEDFILYYGYLFGYENIIIIDNESTNKIVLDVYEKYISKGITLYKEPSYEGYGQGVMFTKYMTMYKDSCDFMIGLDTDEFLVSIDQLNQSKDASDRDVILNTFDEFPENYTLFSIGIYPHSIPDNLSTSYVNQKINRPALDITTFKYLNPPYSYNEFCSMPKLFCRSKAYDQTSVGNHYNTVKYGDKLNTSIGYLHFTSTGQRRSYERCKTIVQGYNYIDTNLDRNKQIDILAKMNVCLGQHRFKFYKSFLLRSFILDLFIKYIKRAPTLDEIQIQIDIHFENITSIIEEQFSTCEECIKNEGISFFMKENEKNNILFYDDPLSHCADNITIIDSISKRLKIIIENQNN